ncbi:hypothetical protein E2C01_086890 [Portunus trituberculatus]|uniref:Uncharacterized protein n=1 Tax=Portunus trituberculatus TaxID=210409 RepID=A0A5B7J522_PORTR|nr:hypothetical protein [Portunus trituberculatus]
MTRRKSYKRFKEHVLKNSATQFTTILDDTQAAPSHAKPITATNHDKQNSAPHTNVLKKIIK